MHFAQVFLVLLAITACVVGWPQVNRQEISEDALDKALTDKRYLLRQLKCATGEATCDPVGRRLKSLAPLVLRGACPQCSSNEMRQIQKVLAYVQKNYPNEWNKILHQYAG